MIEDTNNRSQPNTWVVSTFCASNGCVQVSRNDGQVSVRGSGTGDRPTLHFDLDEWSAFVTGVKAGEFDV